MTDTTLVSSPTPEVACPAANPFATCSQRTLNDMLLIVMFEGVFGHAPAERIDALLRHLRAAGAQLTPPQPLSHLDEDAGC
jgi:hypothetical protein